MCFKCITCSLCLYHYFCPNNGFEFPIKTSNLCVDEIEDHEKEQEYSSLQEKFDRELKELDKALEQKEVRFLNF